MGQLEIKLTQTSLTSVQAEVENFTVKVDRPKKKRRWRSRFDGLGIYANWYRGLFLKYPL